MSARLFAKVGCCFVLGALSMGLVGAAAHAEALPPELVHRRDRVDPYLPSEIRQAVELAAAAEVDNKRGPGNALEILAKERERVKANDTLVASIDLRVAGIKLRSRFLSEANTPKKRAYLQALSTYSRLDLTEPGLDHWIRKAVNEIGTPARALTDPSGRRIKIAVSVQGGLVNRDAIWADLARRFSAVGFALESVNPKEPTRSKDRIASHFELIFAGLEARDEGGRATVRVSLSLANVSGGVVSERNTMFRTSIASDAAQAVTASVDWLVRMGGRDLLFRWLEKNGLEGAAYAGPHGPKHDHGHEGR